MAIPEHISEIKTLGDIARKQHRARPNKTALIFGKDQIDYASLDLGSNRCANALLNAGLPRGARVCYLARNTYFYFEILMGVSKAGAALCPINWRLKPKEIEYILKDTNAEFIFVSKDFYSTIKAITKLNDNIKVIPLTTYENWRDQCSNTDPDLHVSAEDDAVQIYTSGTTGHPKGVRMSNRALLASKIRDTRPDAPNWSKWSTDDVGLIAMPCFHIGGTSFGLSVLFSGATGLILPRFDATKILDAMVDYKITQQFIVPSALQIILEDSKAQSSDFAKLKYIQYGASPIPQQLMKDCIDVFGCGFIQKYGMTETCGTCVALGPEDHTIPENPKIKSVGKALKGNAVRIVNQAGENAGTHVIGEIAVRSTGNMSGYWNNPEATKKALLPDGWLLTGDAGYLDEDGYLFIQDRIKDMIISGGENIYPAEVENALYGHPAVLEVAVIGVPDKKWGESVKAYVVFREQMTASDPELIAYAKTQIASYKCPKTISTIDKLPRNAAGKVLKRELRKPYWLGRERAVN